MEASSERKRKNIVEQEITGFNNASSAIVFGNTVEELIKRDVQDVKFRQYIAGENTDLAITEEWSGPTILKLMFLELDRNTAVFIRNRINEIVDLAQENIRIEQETVRGKPQPQIINLNHAER